MAVYKLVFDWYNEETEDLPWFEQKQTVVYFTNAEEALDYARDVAWNETSYQDMKCPLNAYLYKFDECNAHDEFDERYIAAWFDLDKKIRF
jgi:hypothetical protein